MVRLESHAEGTILPVRAQPGARRSGVLGEHDGALRVAVTSAADKGKANRAIAKLLSESFGIPQSAVELIAGATSRQKRFLLRGMSLEQATAIVFRLLNPEP
jgi:uncharacterized protein (TIGR00251 family)